MKALLVWFQGVARVGVIARHVIQIALRQRFVAFCFLVAIGLMGSVRGLRLFNFGATEMTFAIDLGFGVMALFGTVLAIVATAQHFCSEIDQRTALTLLAKPIGRGEFLVGQLVGMSGLLAAFCFVMLVLLAVALALEFEGTGASGTRVDLGLTDVPIRGLAMAGFAQWLKLTLLSALTLLVASFSRSLFYTVGLGLFLMVLCHLQPVLRAVQGRSEVVVLRWIAELVIRVLPDLRTFDLAPSVIRGAGLDFELFGSIGLYGMFHLVVISAVAVAAFRRREL